MSRHVDVLDVLARPKEWRNGYGVGVNRQPSGCSAPPTDPDHRRQRRVLQDSFRIDLLDTVERTGGLVVNEPFILRGLATLPIRWTTRKELTA